MPVRGGPRAQVPPNDGSDDEGDDDSDDSSGTGGGSGRGSGRGGSGSQPPPTRGGGSTGSDGSNSGDGGDEGDGAGQPGGGGPGGSGQQKPVTTPAQLLMGRSNGSASPFTVDDLAHLMDRLTADEAQEARGLIDINTASERVLHCLAELADEDVAAIVAARGELDSATKATTAWLVTQEILPLEKYIQVAPKICARGTQFTVESLGYADHVGMMTRLQVIYDMRGPLAQTIYYRDITNLGGSFPIREGQQENLRVP